MAASKWQSSGHQSGLPCLLNYPFRSLGFRAVCGEEKPGSVLATCGQESSPCLNFPKLIFAQDFLSPAGIPSPAFLLPFQFPKGQEALPHPFLSHLTSQHRRSSGPLAESQAEKQLLGRQGRRGPEPSLQLPNPTPGSWGFMLPGVWDSSGGL